MTSSARLQTCDPPAPVLAFHLLGQVSYDDAWLLQQHLAQVAAAGDSASVPVLFCEHPELITIGRRGSRGHVRLSGEQLRRDGLAIRWVNRSGGCVLHAPGQLAIYPVVPLSLFGWSGRQYVVRLQQAVLAACHSLQVHGQTQPGQGAVWGQSGVLAALGVTLRDGVACQGAFVNVNPPMRQFAFVDVVAPESLDAGCKSTMGCLLAERRTAVRMATVRAAFVEALAVALGSERYHLHTGHPLLVRTVGRRRESSRCES
jgi:lipoyl(octanoyl) transferase